ncbi:hypothetical protein KR093_010089 [Drosophila rubida]|uniref:Attacin C-terminal domain-containing protein n=1 Tax=Drosophila rubida TaxID=30044 RepID=A0AAD4PM08_9MUSC|nr:hypothetical protein KR093_010089 [Drosophila rubida]
MSSNKRHLVFLLACCLIAVAAAASFSDPRRHSDSEILLRRERSPQHGSVVITGSKDQAGRQAGVQYNHNLYTSKDGRGSIDAYANANRNFDYNRNNVGVGIQGSFRF